VYNDTITLFNRKEGREGDTWYPTVIRNADLNIDKAAIVSKYGPEAADTAVLHIRYRNQDGNKMIGEKPWLPPKRWENLLDCSKAITFTDGNRFDFFWLGDWGNEDPVTDIEYVSDTDFYTYMNKTHDFVFAISSIGGPYSVIPHFEIMGK
jgi:hypothetical protein